MTHRRLNNIVSENKSVSNPGYRLGVGEILVTGGTGFVGRQVANALVEQGHSVHVVSRNSSLSKGSAQTRHTDDLFSASRPELEALLAGIETVVHAAWYVDPADYLVSDKNWDCLSGSIRLALVARDLGISHFVGLGTCIEYEETEAVRSPSTPLNPNTTYGAAKASLFFSLREIFRESTTKFSWCRLFFLHGDGEHPNRLVPFVKSQISKDLFPSLDDPFAVRDFLDVSEAGRQISTVVNKRLLGAFNICSGRPTTIFELASNIARQMGRGDLVEDIVRISDNNDRKRSDVVVGLPAQELE